MAITVALVAIVALSVILGAALPIALEQIGLGASNAATTIQVLMDIAGVWIACACLRGLLDSHIDALPALLTPVLA